MLISCPSHSSLSSCLCVCQGAEGDKTVEMALANPDQFVLKPQREGGGETPSSPWHKAF